MNYLYLVAFFAAGILQDFLFTLSLRLVNKELAVKAASVAFLDSLVSVGVLYSILRKLDDQRSIPAIIIYCLGIAVGTYLAMRFKLGERNS